MGSRLVLGRGLFRTLSIVEVLGGTMKEDKRRKVRVPSFFKNPKIKMNTNKLWSIVMMLILVLGTSFTFTSCSGDDDDNTSSEISVSSLENTLWRADLTMPDPMLGQDFVDVELQETRYFFAANGEAIVCTKYKDINSITGYESGEMINYARYEVVDGKLKVTLYNEKGAAAGSAIFQLKKGALVNDYETVRKVRYFNNDDKTYVEDKLLYYASDDVRFNFEISTYAQNSGPWRYYTKGYVLNVDAGYLINKDQKLSVRGFTEVVATYRFYNNVTGKWETYTISSSVNKDTDVSGYKELLLEKKYASDKVLLYVTYKVWDHRENIYKSLSSLSKTYEF